MCGTNRIFKKRRRPTAKTRNLTRVALTIRFFFPKKTSRPFEPPKKLNRRQKLPASRRGRKEVDLCVLVRSVGRVVSIYRGLPRVPAAWELHSSVWYLRADPPNASAPPCKHGASFASFHRLCFLATTSHLPNCASFCGFNVPLASRFEKWKFLGSVVALFGMQSCFFLEKKRRCCPASFFLKTKNSVFEDC